MNQRTPTRPDLAGRAIGAMFFSAFGAAWIVLWIANTFERPFVPIAACGAVAALLLFIAWRRFRAHRVTLTQDAEIAEEKRKSKIFNAINAAQWIAVIAIGIVLKPMGLFSWIIPTTMFIVGLHFLPLASLFKSRAHIVTGMALMLVACYPWVVPQGVENPVGCLAAGLVLWCSAAWALRAASDEAAKLPAGT